MGEHYRPMYDKDAMHSAIKELHTVLQPRDMLSMAGASLRWLCYHSALGKEDGVILGATKIEQLESNIMEILKGPLDESVADAFENLWTAVRHVAPYSSKGRSSWAKASASTE